MFSVCGVRGCDAVAPIIHEWTYEAMAYDLLGLTSSTFRYESETAGGKMESKEHILDERDELWVRRLFVFFTHSNLGFASFHSRMGLCCHPCKLGCFLQFQGCCGVSGTGRVSSQAYAVLHEAQGMPHA